MTADLTDPKGRKVSVKEDTVKHTPGPYQPKTGEKCRCRRGVWRDNCPNCEGTGWIIDFKAIRAARAAISKATGE